MNWQPHSRLHHLVDDPYTPHGFFSRPQRMLKARAVPVRRRDFLTSIMRQQPCQSPLHVFERLGYSQSVFSCSACARKEDLQSAGQERSIQVAENNGPKRQ
jgi:hypothetical protein